MQHLTSLQQLQHLIDGALTSLRSGTTEQQFLTVFPPEESTDFLTTIIGQPQPIEASGSTMTVGNITHSGNIAIGTGARVIAVTIQINTSATLPLESDTDPSRDINSLGSQLFEARARLKNLVDNRTAASSLPASNTTKAIITFHNEIEYTKGILRAAHHPVPSMPLDDPQSTIDHLISHANSMWAHKGISNGQQARALAAYLQAIEIAMNTSVRVCNPTLIPELYLWLVTTYSESGDFRRAQQYIKKGLEFVGDVDNRHRLTFQVELVRLYVEQGHKNALLLAYQAFELAQRLQMTDTLWGRVLLYLGIALRDSGQREAYLQRCEEAIDVFKASGDDDYYFRSLVNRAGEYIDWGNPNKALADLFLIRDRCPSDQASAHVALNMASAYADSDNLTNAEFYARKSVELYQKLSVADKWGVYSAQVILGEILKDKVVQRIRHNKDASEQFDEAETFLRAVLGELKAEYGDFHTARPSETDSEELIFAKENVAELHRIFAELYIEYLHFQPALLEDVDQELTLAEHLSSDAMDVGIASRILIMRARWLYIQHDNQAAYEKIITAEQHLVSQQKQRELIPLKLLKAQILAAMVDIGAACRELKETRRWMQEGIRPVYQQRVSELQHEIGCN